MRSRICIFLCVMMLQALAAKRLAAQPGAQSGNAPTSITIDYPAENSIFPPDFEPPTFLWRDPIVSNTAWRVEITFADAARAIRVDTTAEPMSVGEIDPRVVAPTNELPRLTPEQEATRTWKPDAGTWARIAESFVEKPATVTIRGFREANSPLPSSEGRVRISTAKEPVGAPIFFRDVPLMPAQLEKGVIQPLPKPALPLVAWRLRYVDEPRSRKLVDGLPTCANCHSFSSDGKTLGLDLDGPQNDKGLYALVPISENLSIRSEDVIAWSSFRGKLGGKSRVGFMSRVSPDGQKVVTMVNPSVLLPATPLAETAAGKPADGSSASGTPRLPKDVQGSFYVANFKDYRFLQVFYPTRGILAWYSRESGVLQPLPGADDPRYVQANAVWSPGGDYLVFARAEARDPYPEGVPRAERANDPNETPIQYDLYRIPFNDGKGGKPEPIAGASRNNKSNSFPKISPDGKWIVFVQANNGLLMRPDGKLYIVPAEGGEARLMTCNTPLMNSWHSFSPNGRWLVFSSKSRGPYTKMFLTHIDENGNDSPPILIENATAANRAVNIPEFVNIPRDAWLSIDAPATEFYRISDNALELMQKGEYAASIAEWNKALAMDPNDVSALSNYGAVLTAIGEFERADELFGKALASDPGNYKAYSNLGVSLARRGKFDEAATQLRKALDYNPNDVRSLSTLGGILLNSGQSEEAMELLREALELDPLDVDTLNNLGGGLARAGKFGEAIPHFEKALEVQPNSFEPHFNLGRAVAAVGRLDEGIRHLERAVELSRGQEPLVLDRLSAMYAEKNQFAEAASAARRALDLARRRGDSQLSETLTARIALYESKAKPN